MADRSAKRLGVDAQVAHDQRLEVQAERVYVGKELGAADVERSEAEGWIEEVADGCLAEPCTGSHVGSPCLRVVDEVQSIQR